MDLGMSPKVKPLVEKVRAMVRDEIMPLEAGVRGRDRQGRQPLDLHQAPDRDPRGPEGQGARAGPVELLADHEQGGLWADHGRIRLPGRGDGLVAAGARDLQLRGARHRQHGGAGALRLARAQGEMAEAPAGGQDPLGLRHDGAGRRLLGRHQPRHGRQARGRRVGARTARSGSPPAPAIRAARSTSSWSAPTPTRGQAQAPLADPGSRRHQGRRGPARHEGVRRRRRPARPHAHPLHRRARAEGEPDPRARPRLRGVAGPAGAGPHPSLHARHRPVGAGAGDCCAGARCRARRSASRWPSSAPTTTSSPRAA